MNLRKAINAKCRDCIYDSLDAGSAAQQIACCIDSTCPLHPVRPITAKVIPITLLDAYHVSPEKLDTRARGLVRESPMSSPDAQNDHLLSIESISEAELG